MRETPLVTLREITADTVVSIVGLSVAPEQSHLVAPNAISLAQALFAPEAWFRAVYADDEPVGFVMLYDESLRENVPERPKVGVWRFMIDQRFQGLGIGSRALRLVIEHVRSRGRVQRIELSYVPGPGCPEPFYRRLGFVDAGRMDDGEVVMELRLQAAA